jgi:hypothetical protein
MRNAQLLKVGLELRVARLHAAKMRTGEE